MCIMNTCCVAVKNKVMFVLSFMTASVLVSEKDILIKITLDDMHDNFYNIHI